MDKIIAFLDRNVQQPELLVKAMPAGTEVAYIERGQPGLAQMARHLEGHAQVDSIHLISHGRPGAIELAGQWLDIGAIEEQREALAAIGAALGEHGDLLIYGCEVAQGEAGQALVRQIAHYTRSDIAASSTLTGAAELGGDWELDVQVGAVGAQVLVPSGLAWGHVLAVTPSVPDLIGGSDTGASSGDEYTFDTTPTFVGTADPFNWVTIYADGMAVGMGQADGSGDYSITSSDLIDDVYDITATANDGSGDSTFSGPLEVTIDTVDPTPGTLAFTGLTDSGPNNNPDNTTDNIFGLSLSGQEMGTTVAYQVSTNDGDTWGPTTNSQSGLADETYQFRAVVTDLAGNSAETVPIIVTIDNSGSSGDAAITAISVDSGASSSDFRTGDPYLTVSGTFSNLAPGEFLQVRDANLDWNDAVMVGSGSGTWSYVDPDMNTVDFTYRVRVRDQAGNNTNKDSEAIDIFAPSVVSVTFNDNIITDADDGMGRTVTIVFDDDMDTSGGYDPLITFGPDVTVDPITLTPGTLIQQMAPTGNWTDARTYVADFYVSDNCVDEDSVTIDVSGTQNAWGLDQNGYTAVHEFEIDTHNPSVVSVVYSDSVVNDDDEFEVFTITVTFDEPMDASGDYDPEITFYAEEGPLQVYPFPVSPEVLENWTETFSSGDGEWSMGNTVYTFSYIIQDMGTHAGDVTIDIEGTRDANGNDQKDYEGGSGDDFQLDTLHLIGDVYANLLEGNDEDDWIYGDNSVDTLFGFDGNDYLNGGQWGDSMVGGQGNDIYIVDNVNDKAVEAASGGDDIVFSSVVFTLGVNVEDLTLTGVANTNGKGNVLDNIILGNVGNNLLTGLGGMDTLNGGDGNDILVGGLGNDALYGGDGSGDGADIFVFDTALNASTNVDTIYNFDASVDKIKLVKSIFTALSTGNPMAAAAFNDGVAMVDATDRIIYSGGNLSYDADGSGVAHNPILFAIIDTATLTGVVDRTDFFVTLV